jgi:sporulation protein YlmC with PRC-barrel domain
VRKGLGRTVGGVPVRQEQILGKGVIDSEARVLGYVSGIEFDPASWRTTHICVTLTDDAVEGLGYSKPRFFGSVLVNIPVEAVRIMSDVVSLNKNTKELAELVQRRT